MRSALRLAVLCLLPACSTSGSDATPESARPRETPVLRLVATDMKFDAPTTIPAGLTRVRLVNQGQVWHAALVTRLPDSANVEDYLAEAREGKSFPVSATDVGGPGQTAVGDSSEVVLPLEPGRYAVVCWSDDHVKSGMIAPLVVEATGADSARAPEAPAADAELSLQDFRFVHAAPFRSGPQVLRVRNEGVRPHNVQLYRLEPGRTLRDFGAWRASRTGPPPAVPVGGMDTMAPGKEGWLPLTLEPGRYFIACGTPEGDVIHAQMGMIEEFEVR